MYHSLSTPSAFASVGVPAEFDLVTGSLVARADIGGVAVRMGYSSATGHTVIAALEVTLHPPRTRQPFLPSVRPSL